MPYNITEASTFTTNVRGKSQTDQVLGGSDTDPSNYGLKDITDRTKWLYDQRFEDAKAIVEASSGGRATLLLDSNNNWQWMARIGKYKPSWYNTYLGSDGLYHPAFYVNGTAKDYFYVGMFVSHDDGSGNPVSQPGSITGDLGLGATYSGAVANCSALGTGWHLMTIHEYAAMQLSTLCLTSDPLGNTNNGRSHITGKTHQHGILDPVAPAYTWAGSGPNEWRHDHTMWGVADLVGNIKEWVHCLRTNSGQLQFPLDNYYTQAEALWASSGLYYDDDGGTGLDINNASTIPTASRNQTWSSMDNVSSGTAASQTSLLCDLLLSRMWYDAGGAAWNYPNLIAGTEGQITTDLAAAVRYPLVHGQSGDSANAGPPAIDWDDGTTSTSYRVAYMP